MANGKGAVADRGRPQGAASEGGVVELIRVHARSVLWFVAAALLAAVAACSGPPSAATEASPPAPPASPTWEVCFTPPPGCTDIVVKALGAAQSSVLVQAYTFTSASIAKALLDAHRRGVKVEVVLDKSQRSAQYSSADFLARVLALRAALDFPDRVRHLVLAATSGGLDMARFGVADWRPAWREQRPSEPWWADDRSNFEDRLREIVAPSLLLCGDSDQVSPVAVGQYLRRQLRFAELVTVAGGDHAFAKDRAAEIAPYVQRHLTGKGNARPPRA